MWQPRHVVRFAEVDAGNSEFPHQDNSCFGYIPSFIWDGCSFVVPLSNGRHTLFPATALQNSPSTI